MGFSSVFVVGSSRMKFTASMPMASELEPSNPPSKCRYLNAICIVEFCGTRPVNG